MNPSLVSFVPAAALVVMGVLFAWIEKKTEMTRELLPIRLRAFAAARSRRRVRIAALLIFVGILMACGNLTDPGLNPLRFVVIWLLTTLLAISMLCYGVADFYQSRVQWVERMRQISTRADAAPRDARAEPSAAPHPADDAATPPPNGGAAD